MLCVLLAADSARYNNTKLCFIALTCIVEVCQSAHCVTCSCFTLRCRYFLYLVALTSIVEVCIHSVTDHLMRLS